MVLVKILGLEIPCELHAESNDLPSVEGSDRLEEVGTATELLEPDLLNHPLVYGPQPGVQNLRQQRSM